MRMVTINLTNELRAAIGRLLIDLSVKIGDNRTLDEDQRAALMNSCSMSGLVRVLLADGIKHRSHEQILILLAGDEVKQGRPALVGPAPAKASTYEEVMAKHGWEIPGSKKSRKEK